MAKNIAKDESKKAVQENNFGGRVFCNNCRHFRRLNKDQSMIFVKEGAHTFVWKNYDGNMIGSIKFKCESDSDIVKIIHNKSDICEAEIKYKFLHIDKVPIYGDPSDLNKNNNCKMYKEKWGLGKLFS